jgi:glycosyltransferase involved in cell wall biosynthesis
VNKKIGLIAPFLTHYRINFYEKLLANLDGQIMFFFQNKIIDDGRPGIAVGETGHYITYSNVSFSLGSVKPVISLDLIKKIKNSSIKILILEGASSNLTSWYFIICKKFLGLKIISWACGWQPESNSGLVRKLKNTVERIFFNNVDSIISYSSTALEYFRGIGVTKPITIAYNGIDTDLYDKSKDEIYKSAELMKSVNSKIIFLYVGGIFIEKRVKFLIDCFKELHNQYPDTSLWIVGDGPSKKEMEGHVINNQITNVYFLGRIEKGVETYFAAADFLVLPGVGGLALNQAMLWGTPCIVSQADGTENDLVIDNVTGFRFKKDDKGSLIETMKKAILLEHERKQEMSQKAQTLILDRSNTDQMTRTFVEVIGTLM